MRRRRLCPSSLYHTQHRTHAIWYTVWRRAHCRISYGGCSTGLGTSASWNVSTTLTRLIGAHDTTKTHSCTRKASQRGHRLPASSTSGLGRGLAAERDHFWASMRNHPVQRPVGRVPSNFEKPGDQIYMVPSNFCDWISLFHQIMVAVTQITASIIYSKTSKQKERKTYLFIYLIIYFAGTAKSV